MRILMDSDVIPQKRLENSTLLVVYNLFTKMMCLVFNRTITQTIFHNVGDMFQMILYCFVIQRPSRFKAFQERQLSKDSLSFSTSIP